MVSGSKEVLVLVLAQLLGKAIAYYNLTEVKERLNGMTLNTVVFNYPPIMTEVRRAGRNETSYEGPSPEFMAILAKHYNLKLRHVRVNQSEVKQVGLNKAIFNLLSRKEIDFACIGLQRVMTYLDFAEYSYPIWILPFTLLQPWPKEATSRLTAPIRPFSYPVWLSFVASTLVLVGCMAMVQYDPQRWGDELGHRRLITLRRNASLSLDYVLTVVTGQGNQIEYTARLSLRMMVGLWLLAMIVLVNGYTGTLKSFLMAPKLKPTVDTIEELAAIIDEMGLIVEPNIDISYKFTDANRGPYKVIGDSLRKHPERFLAEGEDSFANIIDLIVKDQTTYPTPTVFADYLIGADYKVTDKCRMTPASKPLNYFASLVMPQSKGAFYNDAFSQNYMMRLCEGGIVDIWLKTYFPPMLQCHADGKVPERTTAIKLIDFVGVFLILGIGIGLSLLAFAVELIPFSLI